MWEENIFYGEREREKKASTRRLFSFTLCIPASILVVLWASALFILVDDKRKSSFASQKTQTSEF
jgi:hypothetical protein